MPTMEQECASDRESAQLLAQGGDDAAMRSGRRYTVLKIAAVALGAIGIFVMFSTLAPESLQRFAGRSTTIFSEEETSEAKEGYHFEQVCGIDYKLTKVLHNNLGGKGPGDGKEGILYAAQQMKGGEFVRNILVKVNAESDYDSKSSDKNGIVHDFGSIRLDPGEKVDLKFTFYSEDEEQLTLSTFRITYYDLDMADGHKSVEYVIAHGEPKVDLTKDTVLKKSEVTGGVKVVATTVGSLSDNPSKSTELTDAQEDKSAVFEYSDVDSVAFTVGATTGTSPRAFSFALHSALACKQVEVKDEVEGEAKDHSGAQMTLPTTQLLAMVAGSLLLALSHF